MVQGTERGLCPLEVTFLLTNPFPFFIVTTNIAKVEDMAKKAYFLISKYFVYYFFCFISARGPD